MTNPISFRLSDEAMSALLIHASDLGVVKHRNVDRTEALEDIIQTFVMQYAKEKKTIMGRIRKKLQPQGESGLDIFLAAQK